MVTRPEDSARRLLPNITAGPFRSLGALRGAPSEPPSPPDSVRRAITSGDVVPWFPGRFQRLLHAVPDTDDYLNFRGVILVWTACRATALPWQGALPRFQSCRAYERNVGAAPTTGRRLIVKPSPAVSKRAEHGT